MPPPACLRRFQHTLWSCFTSEQTMNTIFQTKKSCPASPVKSHFPARKSCTVAKTEPTNTREIMWSWNLDLCEFWEYCTGFQISSMFYKKIMKRVEKKGDDTHVVHTCDVAAGAQKSVTPGLQVWHILAPQMVFEAVLVFVLVKRDVRHSPI